MAKPEGPATAEPMTLEQVLADTLDRLAHGVEERTGPWRTPALCTRAADGAPRARTVVLRGFDRDRRVLRVHTDRRSAKIADLAAEPRVGLLVYDAGAGIQAILSGRATVHLAGDPVAEDAWNRIHPPGRRPYALPHPPGTEAEAPPPLPEDGEPGRDNFAAILVALEELERLDLRPGGNRRARFDFGAVSHATWLTP